MSSKNSIKAVAEFQATLGNALQSGRLRPRHPHEGFWIGFAMLDRYAEPRQSDYESITLAVQKWAEKNGHPVPPPSIDEWKLWKRWYGKVSGSLSACPKKIETVLDVQPAPLDSKVAYILRPEWKGEPIDLGGR